MSLLLLLLQQPLAEHDRHLGDAYRAREAKRFSEAVIHYEKVLSLETTPENKRLLAARGEARYEIALCLEALGKYEEALLAFARSEKEPRRSSCGIGADEFGRDLHVGRGRCLEALGRHREAVEEYFQAAENRLANLHAPLRRIVDLYEAAGLVDDLKGRLRSFKPSKAEKAIRDLIDTREAGRRQDWASLVKTLRNGWFQRPLDSVPCELDAARLLAAQPDVAVRLLRTEYESNPEKRAWFAYVLGASGAPEAIRLLRERALFIALSVDSERSRELATLVCGLNESEAGRALVAELKTQPFKEMRAVIERESEINELTASSFRPQFPPIPPDLRLK